MLRHRRQLPKASQMSSSSRRRPTNRNNADGPFDHGPEIATDHFPLRRREPAAVAGQRSAGTGDCHQTAKARRILRAGNRYNSARGVVFTRKTAVGKIFGNGSDAFAAPKFGAARRVEPSPSCSHQSRRHFRVIFICRQANRRPAITGRPPARSPGRKIRAGITLDGRDGMVSAGGRR